MPSIRADPEGRIYFSYKVPQLMTKMSDVNGDLESAIDRVVDSYDGPEVINNLESAELPNRRAVIEAYNHIKPALYMGFYSLRRLTRENLRYSVSEHLYPVYELLCEQIARAVTYEVKAGRLDERPKEFAHEVTIGLLNELPALRTMLNSDVLAAYEGDPAAKSFEEIVFSYPAMEAVTGHRLAHYLYAQGVPMIPRIISEYAHSRTGADIHPGARIGEAFFLDHATGVVIGETAELGRGVKVYQGVTLGALSTRRSECGSDGMSPKRHPTIGDYVTIYAGATILGGATVIGEHSVIGGNVFLVKSVAPHSKIFGRPKAD